MYSDLNYLFTKNNSVYFKMQILLLCVYSYLKSVEEIVLS